MIAGQEYGEKRKEKEGIPIPTKCNLENNNNKKLKKKRKKKKWAEYEHGPPTSTMWIMKFQQIKLHVFLIYLTLECSLDRSS